MYRRTIHTNNCSQIYNHSRVGIQNVSTNKINYTPPKIVKCTTRKNSTNHKRKRTVTIVDLLSDHMKLFTNQSHVYGTGSLLIQKEPPCFSRG